MIKTQLHGESTQVPLEVGDPITRQVLYDGKCVVSEHEQNWDPNQVLTLP